MKTLKETFVIIKPFEGHSDLFQNYISFDKQEIELKCTELNNEINAKFKKSSRKNKLPFIPLVIFMVVNLEDAIEQFKNNVADYYSEEDASK